MTTSSPSESHEAQNLPPVFTEVSTLNFAFGTNEPTTISEYEQKRLAKPEPKTYGVNNNIVAVVDGDGIVYAALHENGDKFRLEELQAAERKLDEMGYKYVGGSFYVPQFRKKQGEEPVLN